MWFSRFVLLLVYLYLILRLPWMVLSYFLGILTHLQVGISPRWVGYILLVATEVVTLLNWDRWGENTLLTIFLLVSLAFVGFLVVIFRPEDEAGYAEADALTASFEFEWTGEGSFLERSADAFLFLIWVYYGVVATAGWLMLPFSSQPLFVYAVILSLSAIVVDLLLMKIKGGKRGKLWENIKQAVSETGKLATAPRPTFM